MVAAARAGAHPAAQGLQGGFAGRMRAVDGNVAGALEHPPVDHDVAGEQQPGTAVGPSAVELGVTGRGVQFGVGQALGHGRLAQAIG